VAIQKLVLDTIEEDNYTLIAIHCSLLPYRMAFLCNKHLGLRLARNREDIVVRYKDSTASFPVYSYKDHNEYTTYHLLGNLHKTKAVFDVNPVETELFSEEAMDISVARYLIPEYRNVDYFLKIETERLHFSSKVLLNNILSISQVITAYDQEYAQLKSKNNLIIE